jgi:predicted nucleic acid-binding protein
MILVDSSVWIEYYRSAGDPRYKRWVADAIRQDRAAVNPIIAAEILTFTRDRAQYDAIAADFTAFHWTAVDRVVSLRASDLGYRLRRSGADGACYRSACLCQRAGSGCRTHASRRALRTHRG